MPIVHSDYNSHYPEYYSYKCVNKFPVISFVKDDPISLANSLDSISIGKIKRMSKSEYLRILKFYDDKIMKDKFVCTIKGQLT